MLRLLFISTLFLCWFQVNPVGDFNRDLVLQEAAHLPRSGSIDDRAESDSSSVETNKAAQEVVTSAELNK